MICGDFHTHTTFCDGKNTPREIVASAVKKGMDVIGLSGHGYTPFDLRYCMKDTDGYRAEINRLKVEFADKIQVLLGVEEDAFSPLNRAEFDYIIGSCHYLKKDGENLPFDSSYDHFKKCYDAFHGDVIGMAETYYGAFAEYIISRKPDIVGHLDDITKFDELDRSLFLENLEYRRIAEGFTKKIAQSGCLIEVNTGAMARGYRTSPYPSAHLLSVLKDCDAKLVLCSDSHRVDTIAFGFEETKNYLYDFGFRKLYIPQKNGVRSYAIR